jgi:predicted DCC family thiol-disulfide oxidoreductase YuxK
MPLSDIQPQESLEQITPSESWRIKLLYDGECPLCQREVNFLRKRDAGRGLVALVDIADDNYTPEKHGGIDYQTAMGRIHAVLPDGTIIKNVEVFRQVYDLLGIGWIYAPTRWPVIGKFVDFLYDIWAFWRLPLTGRPNLEAIERQRQQRRECKIEGRCRTEDS